MIGNCSCLIGNSSSGIREGGYLGVPTVNIGTRQDGREHSENVKFVGYDADEIEETLRTQLANGRYAPSHLYGDGNAGARIADILSDIEIGVQKRLRY